MVRAHCPSLRAIDFVDDIRLVDASGEHDALAASMTGMMSILERLGVRYHTKEGKGWWPTRVIPWLGFEVDTRANVVRLEERKVLKAQRLREEISSAKPGSDMSARAGTLPELPPLGGAGRLLPLAVRLGYGQFVRDHGFVARRSAGPVGDGGDLRSIAQRHGLAVEDAGVSTGQDHPI